MTNTSKQHKLVRRLLAVALGCAWWTLVTGASGQPSDRSQSPPPAPPATARQEPGCMDCDQPPPQPEEAPSSPTRKESCGKAPQQEPGGEAGAGSCSHGGGHAHCCPSRGDCPAPTKPSSIRWNPDWPRFHVAEYVATVVFGAGALVSLAIPPDEERWTNVNAFDREIRSQLRLGGQRDRDRARDASDVLITLSLGHLIVDSLVVTWWGHQNADVAWEIAWMDLEALALNALLNGLVAGLTSRQRPYNESCDDPFYARTHDCRNSKQYRSFFSGHTSTAFTAAGLVCMHHSYLPLYGSGWDELACATSFSAAAAVGAMRLVSDQHYASDVLTGAGIGTLVGLGVPYLLHYRGGAEPQPEGAAIASGPPSVTLRVAPSPTGLALWGRF